MGSLQVLPLSAVSRAFEILRQNDVPLIVEDGKAAFIQLPETHLGINGAEINLTDPSNSVLICYKTDWANRDGKQAQTVSWTMVSKVYRRFLNLIQPHLGLCLGSTDLKITKSLTGIYRGLCGFTRSKSSPGQRISCSRHSSAASDKRQAGRGTENGVRFLRQTRATQMRLGTPQRPAN